MLIKGYYKKDDNFTEIYTEDTLYTIARNTGEWNSVKVGSRMATGRILTKETFEAWKSECEKWGEFELSE